jgi:hypothetical protein
MPKNAGAATLTMGAGQTYTTLSAAVSAAVDGDIINILPGVYLDQTASITKALTIQGFGGTASFVQSANTEIGNFKGFLVVDANVTVNNLSFSNASISNANGGNAAGIRFQSGNLVVNNSSFIGNQDGILATPGVLGTGTVTVANSIFSNNGQGSGPLAGLEHAIYVNSIAALTVTDSLFDGTLVGHDIKSRALTSVITGNTLDDGVTGTTSYAADFSNGGIVVFSGNVVNQGVNTNNSSMLAYGAEGLLDGPSSLVVTGNVFNNSLPGGVAVHNFSNVTASITCNAFNGAQTIALGLSSQSNNVLDAALPCTSVPEPPSAAMLLPAFGVLALLFRPRRKTA